MKGARFKVYQDDAKQWRWRLQSANGRILADSGEGYSRKWGAERAAERIFELMQTPFADWTPETYQEAARHSIKVH